MIKCNPLSCFIRIVWCTQLEVMKKKLLLFNVLSFSFIYNSYSQNVAINADGSLPHTSAILDIKSTEKGMLVPRMTTAQRIAVAAPATGLQVFDSDTKSFWFYNGVGWVQFSMGSATNFWTPNGTYIFNNNPGNVGIGTSIPANKFTVQTPAGDYGFAHTDGTVTVGSWIGNFGAATGGWLGTKSNHPLNFFTNGGAAAITIAPNGYVGVGGTSPVNKLQIGTTTGYTDYDFAIGRNAHSMAIYQGPNFTNLQSTANISLNPQNGAGYVGINVGGNPTNKLQIGTLGAAGFTGNDLAIGNGTNAMVVSQSNASTLIASTTDIILSPRYGGTGRVGINTNTPRCPLDVAGYGPSSIGNNFQFAYFSLGYTNSFQPVANTGAVSSASPVNVSIYASDRIVGLEFNAFSDARIKNIESRSNSSDDLATINALQIKNYTMKDVIKYGSKPFKKVIAQEVEKVYPQVISKHNDYIPNVYKLVTKITKTAEGYSLSFTNNHNISKKAKKLQVLLPNENGMQAFEIVSVPSDHEVVINGSEIKSDRVFVYGEEVDDFRTVDYEGLSMLNISATQELSKLVKAQEETIKAMAVRIEQLTAMVKGLKETRLASIEVK